MTASQTDVFPFRKGRLPLRGGAHVFLSGSEAFGLSNSGLLISGGESLVIDTLFDLPHAREMLDAIADVTASAPVRYVFNTHSDGDHIFGNQLFSAEVDVIATAAAAEQMTQDYADVAVSVFDECKHPGSALHPLAPMGEPFDFHPVRVRAPDVTFSGQHTLRVGDFDVELHELGPAHTVGDAVAYVPELNVLFAGDLIGRDIVKITWSGSIGNWITALRRISTFNADIIVSGHGPVLAGKDIDTAIDQGLHFWSDVYTQALSLYDRGVPVDEAPAQINTDGYPGALATLPVAIRAIYHERNPDIAYLGLKEAFETMARASIESPAPTEGTAPGSDDS